MENFQSDRLYYHDLVSDDIIEELTTFIDFYRNNLIAFKSVPEELVVLIIAVKTVNRHKDSPDPEIRSWDIRSGYSHYLEFIEYLNKEYKIT